MNREAGIGLSQAIKILWRLAPKSHRCRGLIVTVAMRPSCSTETRPPPAELPLDRAAWTAP